MYIGRDLLFFLDEWDWILRRRDPSLRVLLEPHVGHLSILPVAIYELFLWLFGLTHYEAFRGLVLSLHLAVCTLVFASLRRHLAPLVALAGACVLLFYGSGWQDILWPFQIGFLLSVAAGIGAFDLIEARSRRGDLGASVCVMVALASSSVGLPVVAGVGVELLLRRAWPRLWVVLAPGAVYASWYFAYGEPESRVDGPVELARFVIESAGAVIGTLLGVGSAAGQGLLVVVVPAFVIVVWRAAPERRARLVGLGTVPIVFWTLLGISRAGLQSPSTSRYLYPAAAFVVLAAAACVRSARLPNVVIVGIVIIASWSVAWNVVEMRDGRDLLLDATKISRIDLGAARAGVLEVPGWYKAMNPSIPEDIKLFGSAFAELGSPVATTVEIARSSEAERRRADGFLVKAAGLNLDGPSPVSGPRPHLTRGAGAPGDDGCVVFGTPGGEADGEVRATSRALLIQGAGPAEVELSLRNFADGYFTDPEPWVSVHAPRGRTLVLPTVGGRPWKVGVRSVTPVAVCSTAAIPNAADG